MISEGSAKEIVSSLYRHLLGREADPEGLAAHQRTLAESSNDDVFNELLKGFMRSNEYINNSYDILINLEIQKLAHSLIKNSHQYNFISIGSHCFTSYMLKRAKLKRESLPFDWIFSSNAMISHCLEDDFQIFLDRSYYSPKYNNANANSCEHNYYKENFGINSIFNHRNPIKTPEYNYFCRAVERFRRVTSSDDLNVFVATFRKNSQAITDFLSLSKNLDSLNQKSLVIGIAIDSPHSDTSHSTIRINHNTCLSSFMPTSEWLDVKFGSPLDDMNLFRCFANNFRKLVDQPDE